ncbi:MAG: cupin domain-containing protein [Hyphomicrobiaceae bacterium]
MADPSSDPVIVISPGQTYVGKQGFTYRAGASAETAGAKKICMNVLPMPDGARARVHYHDGIETIAYLLEGNCLVRYGQNLEHLVPVSKGEQVYVPASVPHAPHNQSGAPCSWIVVHSSGSDQEGIVLMPELDDILRDGFSKSS